MDRWAGIFILIGSIASVVLPLFNIPLVMKIVKQKRSDEISLLWLWGVWGCLFFMLPPALISKDMVFKIFGITNFLLFSVVVVVAMKYRK